MPVERLRKLFNPTSVAVIGASNEPGTPGNVVMNNLLSGAFLGPVMPVNEDLEPICGQESYSAVDTLPLTPDMAVICAPRKEVPRYLEELGRRGTLAAVVLSRGSFRLGGELDADYHKTLAKVVKEYGTRVLGPNCLGFLNPTIGLNASLAHRDAKQGRIAFVSQSDSLFTSVLDWAASNSIGFSHLISLGDRFDIHFGTILDYLNADYKTRAILLYVETIKSARAFMSAARASARNKPVLVIKAGRSMEGAVAAAAHSGAYLGEDDVYDAAFRRAGILRVGDIDTVFDTVQTLAHTRPLKGERLAIVTNGGSPAFLAVDELMQGRGALAELQQDTIQTIDDLLHGNWSYSNPLVMQSNVSGEVYTEIIRTLLQDKGNDAVLVMHVPTAAVPAAEAAEGVALATKKSKRNVLTSWLGIDDAEEARDIFSKAGMPTYFTPEKAIRGFLNMVEYRRNMDMLSQVPASLPEEFEPETQTAREIVTLALAEKRQVLTEAEAAQVLSAYDIPIVPTVIAADPKQAVLAANKLGYPVALKVLSPDIFHKTRAGGVVLDLVDNEAVFDAALAIKDRVTEHQPEARFLGYAVQPMTRRPGAHELCIEVSTDPVFGPTIRFGQGGSLAEIIFDRSVALPPLNMHLASDLVSRTHIHQLLTGYHGRPAVDLDELCLTLVKISQLIVDIPEVFEVEIDPVFADHDGVLALNAQIRVAEAMGSGADQLAIRPYPRELEECTTLKDGTPVHLRPIRPEDEPAHWDFIDSLSVEDKRFRFFGYVGELPRTEMIKFTQIDYDREMAFIVKGPPEEGDKTLGVVRAITLPDNSLAEFAIAIRSDYKRQGMGRMLMDKIIRYCRSRGTHFIVGQALGENKGMVGLAKAMGFDVTFDHNEDVHDFKMKLNPY